MGTQEIADAMDLSRNEVYRFIAVLEDEGFLIRSNSSGKYTMTNRLLGIALKSQNVPDIVTVIDPYALDLSVFQSVPCHLVIQSQDEMVIVRRWEPKDHIAILVPVGFRRPLEAVPSGIMILHHLCGSARKDVMTQIGQRNPGFDPKQLQEFFDEIEDTGALVWHSRETSGVIDICVPLISSDGRFHGVLTIPYKETSSISISVTELTKLMLGIGSAIRNTMVS